MGYRSQVGFCLTGKLANILDFVYDLKKNADYISTYNINYQDSLYQNIGTNDFNHETILEELQLVNHTIFLKKSLKNINEKSKVLNASDVNKVSPSLYSVVFYHGYIKWNEDIDSLFKSLYQKHNLSHHFVRQGEDYDDFMMDVDYSQNNLLKKFFKITLGDEGEVKRHHIKLKQFNHIRPSIKNEFANKIAPPKIPNPDFEKFVVEKFLATLPFKNRLTKLIQYGLTKEIDHLLTQFPEVKEKILFNKLINNTLKDELQNFYNQPKTSSKKLYMDMVRTFDKYKIVITPNNLNIQPKPFLALLEPPFDEKFKINNGISLSQKIHKRVKL